MSGGSHNYIYSRIEEELADQMEDAELNELISDIIVLAHALEWYHSSDTSRADYLETVIAFKKKWFKSNREERLKKYIEESIQKTKEELLNMIGGDVDE
ncbi:MAG: hypothetical protein J6U00_03850 [Ruminococcus sp.]|uniref:hypothetical protein n=1 Tax=Ruminococcus sp. TaxID=41978 RepID=UPI001B0EB928|nr:hypothetical protein [Ruminococcus sp.]MBO7473125.1 hypothetical protein [Ruminococcus sp.]